MCETLAKIYGVDVEKAKRVLEEAPLITEEMDPDAYHKRSYVTVVYGDSCTGDTLIETSEGKIRIDELFSSSNIIFNDRGKDFAYSNLLVKNFNGVDVIQQKIKYIIRHKTNKEHWRIYAADNYVDVTADHSMIVFENNQMKTIKPTEMNESMLVYVLNKGLCKIDKIEKLNNFNNEYVYDIEVDTDNDSEHNFFGNNILIHNTDSVAADTIIHTDKGDKTIEEFYNENENNVIHTHKGHELVSTNDKVLNWTEKDKLHFNNVKYIMRHKVKKAKWRLRTKSGKEIIVTNDHSMIVFRDGKQLEVKPYEILKTDKILTIK